MKKIPKTVTNEDLARMIDTKIEDLAAVVAKGFAAVDLRFAKVEYRLDTIEIRLDKVETRLDNVQSRLYKLEDRFETFGENMNKLRLYIYNLDEKFVLNTRFDQFIAKNALLS